MGPPDVNVVTGAVAAARLHGLAHETLSRGELTRRFPQFLLPEHFTCVWGPMTGFLIPEKVVAAQSEVALRAGAVLHGREAVLRWEAAEGGISVETTEGSYTADRLLFCGGPWSGNLLSDLAVRLTVTRQVM